MTCCVLVYGSNPLSGQNLQGSVERTATVVPELLTVSQNPHQPMDEDEDSVVTELFISR